MPGVKGKSGRKPRNECSRYFIKKTWQEMERQLEQIKIDNPAYYERLTAKRGKQLTNPFAAAVEYERQLTRHRAIDNGHAANNRRKECAFGASRVRHVTANWQEAEKLTRWIIEKYSDGWSINSIVEHIRRTRGSWGKISDKAIRKLLDDYQIPRKGQRQKKIRP